MGLSMRPSLGQIRGVFRVLGDVRDLRHDPAEWQSRMVLGLCELLGARRRWCLTGSGLAVRCGC